MHAILGDPLLVLARDCIDTCERRASIVAVSKRPVPQSTDAVIDIVELRNEETLVDDLQMLRRAARSTADAHAPVDLSDLRVAPGISKIPQRWPRRGGR
jgi:hypothetical protein